MVYFRTKNLNLGTFWRVLQWKLLVYIFYGYLVYLRPFDIFLTFGILRDNLVYFVVILCLYIFPRFGILC
jgi:hypothetical protein